MILEKRRGVQKHTSQVRVWEAEKETQKESAQGETHKKNKECFP